MPGPYGRTWHIVGEPSASKPTAYEPCTACGKDTFRHVFIVGTGWIYRHQSCDPVKPIIERRYARSDKGADYTPMGYVPKNFERAVAVSPDGMISEFTPKRRMP